MDTKQIEERLKSLPMLSEHFNKFQVGFYLVLVVVISIILYLFYSKIESSLQANNVYMEGVIDTKMGWLNDDVRKRLDNIQIINEQKTVTYNKVTTIYQSSQKELADLETLKEKPIADLVAAWNNTTR